MAANLNRFGSTDQPEREGKKKSRGMLIFVGFLILVFVPQLAFILFLVAAVYVVQKKTKEKTGVTTKAERFRDAQTTQSWTSTAAAEPEEMEDEDEYDEDAEERYFGQSEQPIGLSREKRLEQLEAHREAGIIDGEEYRQQKRRIMQET